MQKRAEEEYQRRLAEAEAQQAAEQKANEAERIAAEQRNAYVPSSSMTEDADTSGLYQEAVRDWYNVGLTPEGMLAPELQYDPYLIDMENLQMAEAYNFDPMRQQAMNQLASSQQGQYQTALTQMASSSGLTAADRMAMASQFNRGLLSSQAGLAGEIGTAEAQNIWETERANQDLQNRAYLQNLEMQNQAQLGNIGRLREERRSLGDIARDMYERDIRIGKAEEFAEGL